jgi:uncharacterized protein YndB with AHSA1/START domain
MYNLTKMKIEKPVSEVFESFVDPAKIGAFWFSSSSERWDEGKVITLRYDEYEAQGEIYIKKIELNKKIVFHWGVNEEGNKVTIILNEQGASESTVEILEEGFNENDENIINVMLDNKEGWVYMLTCLKGYLEHGVNLRASLIH